MTLTEKDIRYIARLGALAVTDDEIKRYQTELGSVFDYIHRLSLADTRGVPPTSHVHGVVNFFREDITKDSFSSETLRELAPDFAGGGFRVPRII
jgi:aspartyl/glutamyl-tRNA(Asn/Gln) amidotransferase C subunit